MQGKLGNKGIIPKDSHGTKLGDHLLLVTSSSNKTEHKELNAGKGKLVYPIPHSRLGHNTTRDTSVVGLDSVDVEGAR